MTTPRPWYREPMLWLVIGLPLWSVVAGLGLLGFALHTGGADAVPDEVRRMSQIQLSDLAADHAARRRGLQASLVISRDTGALRLTLPDDAAQAGALELRFVHPLQAIEDRKLTLTPAGAAWLGRFDGALDHDWQLQLRPADGHWRLSGQLSAGQLEVRLVPRLASDAASIARQAVAPPARP